MTSLSFREVNNATRADFERLFEGRGAPSYCWCMTWRPIPNRQQTSKGERKAAIMERVAAGTPVGILAYRGDEPVGWCSVAPRETLRKLSPGQDDTEAGIWSIVCFYVPRPLRGCGLSAALLDAAVDHAFAKGARILEAYAVDEDSPSYRFMGFRKLFEAQGFREIGMAGSRRHLMRLARA